MHKSLFWIYPVAIECEYMPITARGKQLMRIRFNISKQRWLGTCEKRKEKKPQQEQFNS